MQGKCKLDGINSISGRPNQYGARPEAEDEFVDYGDEYDDEEYGSEEAKYYYDQQRANAAMIEGSGASQEYDEEDISDESGMLRQ